MKLLSETRNITIVDAPARGISLIESFYKNVKISKNDFGMNVDCPLGLWSVSAPTIEQALREAQHYYLQYQRDGEYEEI